MDLRLIGFELFIIVSLLAINGLLAMSEMAVVSSRKVRLQQMAKAGSHGAKIALKLASEPSNFLAAIQVGITMIGIFAGAFGGATIAEQLEIQFSEVPILKPYSEMLGISLVVLGVTFISLIFGELVPKRVALSHPEKIASLLAPAMKGLALLAGPLVILLSKITEGVVKLLKLQANSSSVMTPEELQILISEGRQAGVFNRNEESLVKKAITLGDKRILEIMTKRLQVIALNIQDHVERNIEQIRTSSHAYFPVYDGDLDSVLGIVSIKTLLTQVSQGTMKNFDVKAAIQEPLFVSETMLVSKLLELFKNSGKDFAIVLDEHGGTAGIVTAMNLLQSLVGEISNEEADEDTQVFANADGSWLLGGAINIEEMPDFFDSNLARIEVPGDYQTLAGFILGRLAKIPRIGEEFIWNKLKFRILKMDKHRIIQVFVKKQNF